MSFPVDDESLLAFGRYLAGRRPFALRVFLSQTEDEFIDAVEEGLEHGIVQLEGARKEYAKLGELGLSRTLAGTLTESGVPAHPEEFENGHVDLKIKHPAGKPFLYLTECKIWQSVPYHKKGMTQLLRDYASGRHKRGCCLEFVRVMGTATKLKDIRNHVDQHKPLDQVDKAVDHKTIKGGFVTTHKHSSDWKVEVLHVACNLFQPPKE